MDEDPHDDDATRALIAGLARPHKSGGRVVERASLLAAGGEFDDAVAWIEAHGGEPEFAPVAARRSGAYRVGVADAGRGHPQRFILPAGALTG